MKKNKFLALAMSVLMLMTVAFPLIAMAGEAKPIEPDTELEGFVTELVDGGFIMEDVDIGVVMLNVDETTVLDGILVDGAIEIGQYVLVTYDGRLTKSIPPQAHADKVGCYRLDGIVTEFLGNSVLLSGDPIFDKVIVHLGDELPHVYLDVPMTVYFDGIMAMSMPGQVSARCVIVPELTGAISEKDEEGFTLTDEAGIAYRVLFGDNMLVTEWKAADEEPEDEAKIELLDGAVEIEKTEAIDEDTHAILTTDDEDLQASDEAAALEAAIEAARQSIAELEDGTIVTVYYNGQMTKSLPAQVTALEIMIIR